MRLIARARTSGERGQIVVFFAIMLPMILALSSAVIGLGNWFVHAKHLQTKADAGAVAGGGAFQFPCFAGVDAIDQGIANVARQYAGPTDPIPAPSPNPGFNPQVGGVVTADVHAVLNGPNWYDDDSNPAPSENLDICDGSVGANDPMRLEVKVTEDNSFPLASLLPLFPDIKRKAAVELYQTEGMSGMLPIAVRAPKPQSALAIFYDESSGTILDREYLLEKTAPGGPGWIGTGLPASLQGWSTEVALLDPRGWATVSPASPETGVVVAISYRGACNTWGGSAPSSPPPGLFLEPTGKCLEDGIGNGAPSYTNVNQIPGICNQGGNVQVANCYYTTDPDTTVPNDEVVQSGLHFIRSYTPASVTGNGPPEINDAYLSPSTCSGSGYGSGYFTTFPNVCTANFSANIDVGSCPRVNGAGPCDFVNPAATETRTAANVEVKYTIVSGTGNNDDTCDFGGTCDLGDSGQTSGYGVNGQVVLDPAGRPRYAIGLRIRMKNTIAPGRSCDNNGFNGSCEWYFRGIGRVDTQWPNNGVLFNDPVQRAFRGNTVTAGSIRWLRLKADRNPCGATPVDDSPAPGLEGSVRSGGASCFVVEMGLKGGIATDVDDEAFLFNDGVGTSQLGVLDCTATGAQSIIWELMHGCPPLYGTHNFNTDPLCPPANSLFTTPNPGPPWDPASAQIVWPPIRCVKTRPTGQSNDLTRGLNGRFFYPNDPNPSPQPPNSCPSQIGTGYIQGRNYWRYDGSTPFGYNDNGPPAHLTNFAQNDSRKVVIFLTTPESFTGSGQNTYPITGAIAVYITGYGTVSGNGTVTTVDPCGEAPPADVDCGGGNCGGRAVWGHFINTTVLSAGATPSSVACNPGASSQPCVPVLVE